jgi:acyl carrier protein
LRPTGGWVRSSIEAVAWYRLTGVKREEFMGKLAGVLDRRPVSLSSDSVLEELGWDSMSELSFIALADKELKARVSPSAIESCKTVGDLLVLVAPQLEP